MMLFILLFVGLCLCSACTAICDSIFGASTRSSLLAQSVCQSLLVFIIPAVATYRIFYSGRESMERMGIGNSLSLSAIIMALITFFAALPAMNLIIDWNYHIAFPDSLEKLFRQWEAAAQGITDIMLATQSIGGLISGVLIVGVLTGIAEEFFFRGALQRMLVGRGMTAVGAIWLSALVFSIMHFQPFGFIPRLLLGAFFGYLLLWSGSIWLPALLHAVNNSMVVMMVWLSGRGVDTSLYEHLGLPGQSGYILLDILSVVATALLLICSRRIIASGAGRLRRE